LLMSCGFANTLSSSQVGCCCCNKCGRCAAYWDCTILEVQSARALAKGSWIATCQAQTRCTHFSHPFARDPPVCLTALATA
jgi:hypothetical protein